MAGAEHRGASSGDRRGRTPQHGGGRQRKPERIPCELARPVFFVGFMGAGKTSVSRRLARLCGIASIDMDSYIERREGRRIRDIFAEDGEGRFREIESEATARYGARSGLVIACGGGVVTRPENYGPLRQNGTIVLLDRPVDQLGTEDRPVSQARGVEQLAAEQVLDLLIGLARVRSRLGL